MPINPTCTFAVNRSSCVRENFLRTTTSPPRLSPTMYGPPPRRKRNLRTPQVGLRKCIRPLLEWITPGQDGMRCALFSINWSVAKDYFRFRIWRAPGSTVVPSPHSPADLAGNHDLAVVARLQPHRPILGADMVHSWRVRPRRFERVC